jgi:hypothetical protein
MEGITEPRLLPLFGGECLNWLEIEVVIKMKVIEILPVNEEVEHVVPLSCYL